MVAVTVPNLRLTSLRTLFDPRAVAVVGASSDERSLAGKPLLRLKQHGFARGVYPVNPRHASLAGFEAVPSILELPDGIDVALIVIRAELVPQAIRDCAARGITHAVVMSSGFEDRGGEDSLSAQLDRAVRDTGVRLVGPNCEGLWSIPSQMTLTFGSAADRPHLLEGAVTVLSQSGSLGGACMRELQDRGVGCRYFVSTGNELDLTTMDLLEYAIEEGGSRVVAMFVEGLHDGHRLRELAYWARQRDVRLVMLRAGGSAMGQLATLSHTGRVATADVVYRDVLAQSGVLEVTSLRDFVEATRLAAIQAAGLPAVPASGRSESGASVVAISGGSRAILADAAERRGVPLATFSESTLATLKAVLPQFAFARNPVDVTGQLIARPDDFRAVVSAVVADQNTEALVVQYANGGEAQVRQHSDLFAELARREGKPIVASLLAGHDDPRVNLDGPGHAVVRDPGDAIKYLEWLYTFARPVAAPPAPPALQAKDSNDSLHSWAARAALLEEAGIQTPRWAQVTTPDELKATCGRLRRPLVVKAAPEAAEHKTELGLVHLRIESEDAALVAFRQVQSHAGEGAPVLVQEMVSGGFEMLLTVRTDPDLGPVLALGFGGTLTEWMKDIVYLSLPATMHEIRQALRRLKSWALLQPFRGRAARDVDALVDTAQRLSTLYLASYRGGEIEINPLLVLGAGEGVQAVDVLCVAPIRSYS